MLVPERSERLKKLVAAMAVAAAFAAAPASALACESCFGASVDSEVTRGIGFAMLLLLLVVSVVFAGILMFFKNAMARSEAIREGRLTPPGHPSLIPPTALN